MSFERKIVAAALLAAFSLGFAIPLLAAASQPACEMTCCPDKGASCSRKAHSSPGPAWAASACGTGCSAAISAGVSRGLVELQPASVVAGAPAPFQIARVPEPPATAAGYRVYLHQRPPPVHLAF